jgi:glycosyltransferase involved in cell wall biosynthesis
MNISTMLNWDRPAVGVIRVETECAAFALEDGNIKFCRFDNYLHRYTEVDKAEVITVLEKIKNYKKDRDSRKRESIIIKMGRRKRNTLETIEISPKSNRKAFYWMMSKAEKVVKTLIGYTERVWWYLRVNGNKYGDIFSAGDTYLSLGLPASYNVLPYLYKLKKKYGLKVITCCHDIIPIKYPHYCGGDVASEHVKYFADLARCSDKILCVSKCTRTDLEELLRTIGARIPKLKVFMLGSEIMSYDKSEISPEVEKVLEKEYILFVSTIERRKNHETLYKAYTRILRNRQKVPILVFVGMQGWGVNDLMSDIRFDPIVRNNIVILNYVSDYELVELYRNCLFTVFPSLYEGWGLPVAESLEYGKLCLASNVASIPEVGGNLIEYLDPWNVQEWVERIEYYFDNRDKLKESEKVIKENYKTKKWHDTAMEVFKECKIVSDQKSEN